MWMYDADAWYLDDHWRAGYWAAMIDATLTLTATTNHDRVGRSLFCREQSKCRINSVQIVLQVECHVQRLVPKQVGRPTRQTLGGSHTNHSNLYSCLSATLQQSLQSSSSSSSSTSTAPCPYYKVYLLPTTTELPITTYHGLPTTFPLYANRMKGPRFGSASHRRRQFSQPHCIHDSVHLRTSDSIPIDVYARRNITFLSQQCRGIRKTTALSINSIRYLRAAGHNAVPPPPVSRYMHQWLSPKRHHPNYRKWLHTQTPLHLESWRGLLFWSTLEHRMGMTNPHDNAFWIIFTNAPRHG